MPLLTAERFLEIEHWADSEGGYCHLLPHHTRTVFDDTELAQAAREFIAAHDKFDAALEAVRSKLGVRL